MINDYTDFVEIKNNIKIYKFTNILFEYTRIFIHLFVGTYLVTEDFS